MRDNPCTQIGKRYDFDAGMEMLQKMPLGRLMNEAYKARLKRMPDNCVSFVYDTNPNYTNICASKCSFCAFYREKDHSEAYTLSPDQLAEKVKKAYDSGAATVLMQGGHNPKIRLKDWIAYIRAVRKTCPDIHIHPFSPAEYVFMAQIEKISVEDVLKTIFAEGIDTIPGGGAEILTETVRSQIAENKASSDQWLQVCETAHKIGFRTTATMMFGHIETDKDIVEHLLKLRDLQDKTGGFSSFIAWSFKPGGSLLGSRITSPAHPAKYVRIIAAARLILDNFPHIQSSWFSESIPAGQLGLLAGADDFGGILVEENVLLNAGHKRSTTLQNILTIIKRAGFKPIRRDSHYNFAELFEL